MLHCLVAYMALLRCKIVHTFFLQMPAHSCRVYSEVQWRTFLMNEPLHVMGGVVFGEAFLGALELFFQANKT